MCEWYTFLAMFTKIPDYTDIYLTATLFCYNLSLAIKARDYQTNRIHSLIHLSPLFLTAFYSRKVVLSEKGRPYL